MNFTKNDQYKPLTFLQNILRKPIFDKISLFLRLSKTLATISHDLDLKIFSLNLDNRCMDVRKKLTVPLARTPNVESTRDTFTRTFN